MPATREKGGGLIERHPMKLAMIRLDAPFSFKVLNRGYHAWMGPMDRIPAREEKNSPFIPVFFAGEVLGNDTFLS